LGTENAAKPQPTALYHVWWLQTVLTCYSTARVLESRLSGARKTSLLGSCDLYPKYFFGNFFECTHNLCPANSVPQTLSLAAMNERCAEQAGARIYMVTKLKKRLQIAIYMHIEKKFSVHCNTV
jgi:hypothetical protein